MCNSKIKAGHAVADVDGRPVLQPAGNRVAAAIESGKKAIKKPAAVAPRAAPKLSPPVSPKSRSAKAVLKRGSDPNGLNSSTEKPATPKSAAAAKVVRKKPKKAKAAGAQVAPAVAQMDFMFVADRAPGSIAAAQREQASLMQAQRKMRIAHYGRTAAKAPAPAPADASAPAPASQEEKRCSFITPNSDPLYIAYHDDEWGVPVHDDKMLFELLVLSGAQVGLDWTTILKRRNDFRAAFSEFEAEMVAGFTERRIASVSLECGLDLARVRGFVDNANRILEVRKEFGSLNKYLWGFVNNKPISTNYKFGRKIPVKTSKSESISKDLVRRGFRFVGPTVVHSFMQAAGLTNDHLVSCPRHPHCTTIAATTN